MVRGAPLPSVALVARYSTQKRRRLRAPKTFDLAPARNEDFGLILVKYSLEDSVRPQPLEHRDVLALKGAFPFHRGWSVTPPRRRSVLSTSGFGQPLRRSANETASGVHGTDRNPGGNALAPAGPFVLAGLGQSVESRGKKRSLALVLHP